MKKLSTLIKGWEVEWPVHLPIRVLTDGSTEGDFDHIEYTSADYPSRAKARARARKEAKDPSRPIGVAYIRPFHMEERSYGRLVRVYDGEREEVSP